MGWVLFLMIPLMIALMPLAVVMYGFDQVGQFFTDSFAQISDYFSNLF